MSTQNIPNSHISSRDKSESKSINADKREPKRANFNACSMDESK